MKKKIGFVTNSSSTSFLIGVPDKENIKDISVSYTLQDSQRIDDIDDLEENSSYLDLSEEELETCKEIINNGGAILIKTSYLYSDAVRSIKKSNNLIKVLFD